MSPITAEEAWAATDPSAPKEAREASAQAIMAGVAANDAYINSRPELEQVILRAQGGQVPPPHGEADKAAQAESGNAAAGSIEGTATEEAAPGGALSAGAPAPGVTPAKPADSLTEEERTAEVDALQRRLAELEGGA